jgi:hypothetical protein
MSVAAWILLAVVIVCVLMLLWLLRQVSALRHSVQQVHADAEQLRMRLDDVAPLLADTRSALRKAEDRNVKADDLVHAATALTERADAASQLAYRVATSPLVRVAAFGRGVRRGVIALRGNDSQSSITPGSPRSRGDLPVPTTRQVSRGRSRRTGRSRGKRE